MADSAHFIFVLGHANDPSGKLSDVGRSRVEKAALVWRSDRGAAPSRIVLTGGFAERFNTTAEPHWLHARRFLLQHSVPGHAIHTEGLESAHTVEDIALIVRFLRKLAPALATVVTSQSHIERCRMIFDCLAPGNSVEFVGAPDVASPGFRAHEDEAIARLVEQGGVTWEDKLYRLPESV